MIPALSTRPLPRFTVGDCHGTIAEHRVIWKTHVTSGGFLMVNNGHGYGQVNPHWSRTSHVHRQDFWVHTPDGQEVAYWLEGYEHVALRQGYQVAVLVADGHIVQIVNRTTGLRYRVAGIGDLVPLQPVMRHDQIVAQALIPWSLAGIPIWATACAVFGSDPARSSDPGLHGRGAA